MATAVGSSRFAVTCGLLRQYVMEQQQPPVMSLLATVPEAKEEEVEDARTMQLFPPRAGGSTSSEQTPSQQAGKAAVATAPLTIFYDGRVLVFDDVPAEKAVELMRLAGSVSSPPPVAKEAPLPTPPQPVQPAPAAALPEMPIARKVSLQRFLQKRKHRITASEPYKKAVVASAPEKSFAVVMPVKDEPATWLGL